MPQLHKTLLFIGAHPDDETFGVGATLARYAADGADVYYACATKGEAGTVDAEFLKGHDTQGDLRWSELDCASKVLGLKGVFHLGYRDSGMAGWEDNKHPLALMTAPVEEVAGRIVKIIRDTKPQVVVTFDPIGGYRHPDHIATHKAAVEAFHAAGDPGRYPEAGPAFQPAKLYFHVFPRRMLRIAVKLMPLFGHDPRRFGKNKDIDVASLAEVQFPVHAIVRLDKRSEQARDKAALCHASQTGGRPPRREMLGFLSGLFGKSDHFMRAFPAGDVQTREKDLFDGTSQSPS